MGTIFKHKMIIFRVILVITLILVLMILSMNVNAINSGGEEQSSTEDIIYDVDSPVIESVVVMDEYQNIIAPVIDNSIVENKGGYGYFIDDSCVIRIKASDGEYGVGVKNIYYYFEDYEGNKGEVLDIDVNEGGEAFIKCDKGFKGHLFVRAQDFLGNQDIDYKTFCGIVVNSKNKSTDNIELNLALEKTDYKDGEGLRLYNDKAKVLVEAKNDFSGIKSIKWEIIATDGNSSGRVEYDGYGNAVDSLFNKIEVEENLVSKVSSLIDIENNSNNIEFRVEVEDWFNNKSEKSINLSIDKTRPQIDIEYDSELSEYNNHNIIATIKVREENFNPVDFKLELFSTKFKVTELSDWTMVADEENIGGNLYMAKLIFVYDGDYRLSASCKDRAGNESVAMSPATFTIDKTSPKVKVEFDNNDVHNMKYFNEKRKATITIEEEYFDKGLVNIKGINKDAISDWASDKGKHVASISFDKDGRYSFEVEVEDKSGNMSERIEIEDFYIDTTVPEIKISGVEDESANNGIIAPVIDYSDNNLEETKCTYELYGANKGKVNINTEISNKDGSVTMTFRDFERTKEMDDIYTLNALTEDKAGNKFAKTIKFSVNRFGSVYIMDDELKSIDGKYVKSPVDIVLKEVNADALDDNSFRIVLSYNGNQRDLVNGTDFNINKRQTDNGWNEYEYILGKDLFKKDGRYSVILYSRDLAGNKNENNSSGKNAEISFGIDSTKPNVIPLNIENNCEINNDSYEAVIAVNDNLVLEGVDIELNNKEIEGRNEDNKYIIDIPESEAFQSVKIMAYDAAGNETIEKIDNIMVCRQKNEKVNYYNYLIVLPVIGILLFVGNKIKRKYF